jgi:hypothetical protein
MMLFGRAARQVEPGSGELVYQRLDEMSAEECRLWMQRMQSNAIQYSITRRQQSQKRGALYFSYQELWFQVALRYFPKERNKERNKTREGINYIVKKQDEWATQVEDTGLSLLEETRVVKRRPLPPDTDARINCFITSVERLV